MKTALFLANRLSFLVFLFLAINRVNYKKCDTRHLEAVLSFRENFQLRK
jgi:hypothetical protein